MDFLERDLEEIIFNSSTEKLISRGLSVHGKRYRQLRIGNYGIADMVTIEKDRYENIHHNTFVITVYELKKEKIGIGAFLQALGYVKGIRSYLEFRRFNHSFLFKIKLVGRDVDTSGNFCYLTDFIEHCEDERQHWYGELCSLDFYTYTYNIDGIKFENKSGYDIENKGF